MDSPNTLEWGFPFESSASGSLPQSLSIVTGSVAVRDAALPHSTLQTSLYFLTLLTAFESDLPMLADLITSGLSRESLFLSFLSFTCYAQAQRLPSSQT